MQEKLKKNLCPSTEQGWDTALGGAVLGYQTGTRTSPAASLSPSLPLLLELQMLPTGTLRAAGWTCHRWAQKLQPHPSSHRKKAGNGWPCASWQGISKSTAILCLFLMALCSFRHHTKLFNKWAVQSTTSTKITHTGKQSSGWISWSQGLSASIRIIKHGISYWSHATGCTSKEAQEGKLFFSQVNFKLAS